MSRVGRNTMRRAVACALSTVLAPAALALAVSTTAPEVSAATSVSGTGKGIAGGALIGGEVGYLGLAAFGVHNSWPYYVFPPALAIGGGIGGYFIEKKADPEVPLFMLAGGMAMIIPTLVVGLNATSYRPSGDEGSVVETAPADGGKGSATGGVKIDLGGKPPAAPAPAKPKDGTSSRASAPLAVLNYNVNYGGEGILALSLPAVKIAPAYSTSELVQFGVAQRYEVHAPVVAVAF